MELVYVIAFIVSVLSIIFWLKLYWNISDIRNALIDEEFPVEDLMDLRHVTSFRLKVVRVKGRFGGTYQRKGGEPVIVEPLFSKRKFLVDFVEKALENEAAA